MLAARAPRTIRGYEDGREPVPGAYLTLLVTLLERLRDDALTLELARARIGDRHSTMTEAERKREAAILTAAARLIECDACHGAAIVLGKPCRRCAGLGYREGAGKRKKRPTVPGQPVRR